MKIEFERNEERYRFLRWAQTAFDNFRAVPPATGIVHQVNLEYLGIRCSNERNRRRNCRLSRFPGRYRLPYDDDQRSWCVGWGVGGIEAEAGMLGQPLYFVTPEVIGFKLTGKLAEGATATDLALTVTQMLRKKGVVGKFVEFFGPGLSNISLADRATVANMAPEYGATMGFFPVDNETLELFAQHWPRRRANRSLLKLTTKHKACSAQMTRQILSSPIRIELDLVHGRTVLAGPKRPQDRVELTNMKQSFNDIIRTPIDKGGYGLTEEKIDEFVDVKHHRRRS